MKVDGIETEPVPLRRGGRFWLQRAGIVGVRLAWMLAAWFLGGAWSLLPFCFFIVGLLLPIAALVADALRGTELSDELRVCAGGAVALLTAIPIYYVRRTVPLPAYVFDAAIMVAALGAAVRTGSLRRFVRAAQSPLFSAAGWLFAVVVPALICLVWLGFEVRRGDGVYYYGLFTIDFSNLAGMVALIRASPGAPQFVTAGGGPLHYHWWFFTIPALLSEFGGFGLRASSALALCNCLAAVLLSATICAVIGHHLRQRAQLAAQTQYHLAAASAAIVILAPFSTYAYYWLIAQFQLPWFTSGTRNRLLLSVVNSMSSFGNNTLALTLVLLVGAAICASGQRSSWRLGVFIGLAGISICGLSVTLTFPLILASAAWILMGKVKRPMRLVSLELVIGAAGLPLLYLTNITGHSAQRLVLSFDGGQFVQNVAFGLTPIWLLTAASLLASCRLSFPWLLIAAGLLVPTLIDIAGQNAIPSTMSMKTASLLPIAASTLVADGIVALVLSREAAHRRVWQAAALLALLAGLANSAAYTLQFAFYRMTDNKERAARLPADYVNALEFVRRHTPATAIVLDPSDDALPGTVGTLLVGERRVWLPTRYGAELFKADLDRPDIMSRSSEWRAWERANFSDEALAKRIADGADVLIGPPTIRSASWTELHRVGQYVVYASRRQSRRKL